MAEEARYGAGQGLRHFGAQEGGYTETKKRCKAANDVMESVGDKCFREKLGSGLKIVSGLKKSAGRYLHFCSRLR